VRLCAGLPLALRLARSHLSLQSELIGGPADVDSYISQLTDGRLCHFDADAPVSGESSISDVFRVSENGLTSEDRDAWRRLGVFRHRFDTRAADVVAKAGDSQLERLVRSSLLERVSATHYRLHDLAAEYGRTRLASTDDLVALETAHAQYFISVCSEADQLSDRGKATDGLVLFDRERGNIETAYHILELRKTMNLLAC